MNRKDKKEYTAVGMNLIVTEIEGGILNTSNIGDIDNLTFQEVYD